MGNELKSTVSNQPRVTEDSGLHDIKSLAASAKNRISARRSTTQPPMDDDAILATASASFKAAALPEPARLVSLPNPGYVAPLARAPRATNSEAVFGGEAVFGAPTPAASVATNTTDGNSVTAARVNTPFPQPTVDVGTTAKAAGSKRIAIGGIAAVVVAGGAFAAVKLTAKNTAAPTSVAAVAPAATDSTAASAVPAPTPTKVEPAIEPLPTVAPIEEPPVPVAAHATSELPKNAKKPDSKAEGKAESKNVEPKAAAPAVEPKAAEPLAVAPKADKKDGDQSLDDLLREAGVDTAAKKEAKPTLEKKELSRDDIASVMKSKTGAAVACYGKTGTSGTVGVRLSVSPEGKVTKAVATGSHAGTPAGDCVVDAVKNATFPPWDGRPATVTYQYLLSD